VAVRQDNAPHRKLIGVERVFEVQAMWLMEADFGDLLEHELADRDRYQRVEQKIAGADFEIRAAPDGGVVLDIKPQARVEKAKRARNARFAGKARECARSGKARTRGGLR
jgi:hypothetical protein